MTLTQCDIAIVGAGPAGIAAAIGAARVGGNILLIEESVRIGGNATAAMVGTICGLSRCGKHAPTSPRIEIPGFAGEFARHVATRSGSTMTSNEHGLAYLPYRADEFESVAHAYLMQHQSVSLSTLTSLASIEHAAGYFSLQLCAPERKSYQVVAKTLIDTTGDSAALQLLGLHTRAPEPPQAAALVFELSGLPSLDERTMGFLMRKLLREECLDGHIEERHTYVSLVPGSLHEGVALFKLGIQPPAPDRAATSVRDEALVDIATITSRLSSSTSFQNIRLTHTAPRLGLRSGYRGVGIDTLSDDAIHLAPPHPKGIALGLWPAEVWNTPIRPEITFLGGGGSYEIPLGSLCARGAPGVYFAGRALSATDLAIASARVIGTCLATGFAAGQLAARTLRGDREDAVVHALRAEQVEPFYRLPALDNRE